MGKKAAAEKKYGRKKQQFQVDTLWKGADYRPTRSAGAIEAMTEAQGHYMLSIERNILTFGLGPAGTGKTYVCAAMAAQALLNGDCERLIITRPAVEACEKLGFLPGEKDEKFAPYFEPFRDVLEERLGQGHVEGMIKSGRIVATPLAYMRGKSFKDAYIILDEGQNTTPSQMKLFLTRIGEKCKVIVNGDSSQTDLRGANGLDDSVARLRRVGGVGVIEFSRDDIVRSGFVRAVLEAYE